MTVKSGEKLCKKGKGGFFRSNIFIILAFLLPAAIMLAAFIAKHFFPFGNRMIMVSDSWHQYYPFLAEYQRMLKEGESVLYSWNTGGGSNFLGVIGNYLGSPLYLLSYFVPSGTPWLQVFLALTVAFRIGCAGGFSAIFFRKVFRRNDLSLVYFSLMYALCAFVLGYYWNMMWLDTVALLPLVAAGVIGVLRDKKYSLYIISLALSVLFSFYMGYMVCLFVLILSVCYTVVSFVSFKESFKNAGKMLIYSAVAFMLTAFMTVPVFMALQASDSAGAVSSFPLEYTINYSYGYKENTILHTLLAIARTATNLLAYTRPIMMDQGLPNIACGVLSLVLAVFYFTTKKIKLREKIVSGSLLVFFMLSFVVNQLNYIWHGMSTPAMVYYRFSYIFSFVLVVMAYRAFTLIDSFSKKSFIFASALLVIYLGAAFFLQKKLSVAITAVAAVIIVAGFALYRAGKMKYRVLSLLLCLFVICEMGLSAVYGVHTVGSTKIDDYPLNYDEVMEFKESMSGEDEIYRTEFIKTHNLNDGDLYSLYSMTTFNSMVDSSYADFLAEFGLAASMRNNRYAYHEATPVANLFLNIKYLIARDGQNALDMNHLNVVTTADECVLYENTAYIPMGFMASTELLEYKLHDTPYLPVYAQNDIFSFATGIDKDVFATVTPSRELYGEYEATMEKIEGFDYYYSVDLKENPVEIQSTEDEIAPMYVEYTIEEDGNYYGMLYSSEVDDVNIYVNGDEDDPITLNQSYAYVAALGEYKKGDRIKVELPLKNKKVNSVATYLLKLDDEVLASGIEKLSRNTMTVTEWSDRGLKGTINADEAGLFFTSVLYDEGWTAYVDGEVVEITPVADTFVAFELNEGEHTIELKFTPKGLYLGAGVTVVGVILFVLLGVLTRLRRKKNVETEVDLFETAVTYEETDEKMSQDVSETAEDTASEEESASTDSDEYTDSDHDAGTEA